MQRLARAGIHTNVIRLQSLRFREQLRQVAREPIRVAPALWRNFVNGAASRFAGTKGILVGIKDHGAGMKCLLLMLRGGEHRFRDNPKRNGRGSGRRSLKETAPRAAPAARVGFHAVLLSLRYTIVRLQLPGVKHDSRRVEPDSELSATPSVASASLPGAVPAVTLLLARNAIEEYKHGDATTYLRQKVHRLVYRCRHFDDFCRHCRHRR